jgi:outer membrane murein-binding lipoprotein Lpp
MARNRSEKFVENTTEKDELNAKIAALENKVSNLQYELNKKVIMLHFDPYFCNST